MSSALYRPAIATFPTILITYVPSASHTSRVSEVGGEEARNVSRKRLYKTQPAWASHNSFFRIEPILSIATTKTFVLGYTSASQTMSGNSLKICLANTSTTPNKDLLNHMVSVSHPTKRSCLSSNIKAFDVPKVPAHE